MSPIGLLRSSMSSYVSQISMRCITTSTGLMPCYIVRRSMQLTVLSIALNLRSSTTTSLELQTLALFAT